MTNTITATAGTALVQSKAARRAARRVRDERGMTTAEYAVGTVGAASLAGLLITILTSEEMKALLMRVFKELLEHFIGRGFM